MTGFDFEIARSVSHFRKADDHFALSEKTLRQFFVSLFCCRGSEIEVTRAEGLVQAIVINVEKVRTSKVEKVNFDSSFHLLGGPALPGRLAASRRKRVIDVTRG